MGKQELQSRLITELTNIGVPTEVSTSSDIVIDQLFTEEYNQGTLHYKAKILFDQTTEIIYFWESTTSAKTLESFVEEKDELFNASSHHRVKSIGVDRNGQQHDITLDLNTIPSFIQSFAKSQHWNYKKVSIESKASYQGCTDQANTEKKLLQEAQPMNKSGCFTLLLTVLALTALITLVF